MSTKNQSVNHTPGPWQIDDRKVDEGAAGTVVAEVMTCFGGHTIRAVPTDERVPSMSAINEIGRANANLIAAAPAMYKALQVALETFSKFDNSVWPETVREAIALAEGRVN